MSRTITPATPPPPSSPPSTPFPSYKTFIWDTGTTSRDPALAYIYDLAIIEYAPAARFPAHLSLKIRTPPDPSHPTIPRFPTAFRTLTAFIRAHTPRTATPLLVSHNAPFDAGFLSAELSRHALPFPSDWLFACSLDLFRTRLPASRVPDGKPFSQANLSRRFRVTVCNEHHAEEDVRVLRDILARAAKELPCRGLERDVQDALWNAARPLRAWAVTPRDEWSTRARGNDSDDETTLEEEGEAGEVGPPKAIGEAVWKAWDITVSLVIRLLSACAVIDDGVESGTAKRVDEQAKKTEEVGIAKPRWSAAGGSGERAVADDPRGRRGTVPRGMLESLSKWEEMFRTENGGVFHVDRKCKALAKRKMVGCEAARVRRNPCRLCARTLFQEWEVEGWIVKENNGGGGEAVR